MNRPMQRTLSRFLVLVGLLALPAFSSADPPDEYKTYEIESLQVVEEKPMTAASDQVVIDKDFLNLPRQTSSDLLRIMPGVFINQHTGGGKAHQIFLRGFDILLLPVLDGNPDESGLAWSSCAWVGDGHPGVVTTSGTGNIEMTFHSDHIFGDAEAGADLNDFAPGFAPFAELAIEDESCGPGEDRCVIATDEELYEGWFDLRNTDPEMEYVYGMLIYSLGTVGHCGEGHCLH